MNAVAAIAEINDEVGHLVLALAPVTDGFARIARAPGKILRDDLADIRGEIADLLGEHDGFVAGCGVIPVPHLLDDAPYWMEWFWAVPKRDPEVLRVNLEPMAPDFFDYTTADWFVTPARTRQAHIAGPYVDYVCTNEYATTLAVPVEVRGEFVGIAGLDVTVSGWERRILPILLGAGEPLTLTNASGRVIASTADGLFPGQRVRADENDEVGTTSFGWKLLRGAVIGSRG